MNAAYGIDKPNPPCRSIRHGQRKEETIMQVLNIALTMLAWILAGIVIWAIWPWLLQFLAMAQQLHALGL